MWLPLKNLISPSLKKAGIAKSVSDAMVCEEFNKIAAHILGNEAEHCRAVYLKEGNLTVAVLSGSAANELKLYEHDILRALAERFGERKVAGLRFMM
jgi:predicted nucleic acid-binding Zn ribbon protein